MSNEILVTRPSLPPLEEYIPYLEKIWESKLLTNNGPFHQELESALAKYLGVKYVSLFANGTLALIIALKSLNLKGEVITTPYSFVASSNAIVWSGLKPVFADIEPETYTLDPIQVEKLITAETVAILPVHIYGYSCQLNEFRDLAKKYGLKLVYDAAHAFGVKRGGQSLCNFGDLSILSFHATKAYNTFEGGAVICHDKKTKERIDYLKNFGITDETSVVEAGINGKMNELQAAFGILQLKYVDSEISKRKIISDIYCQSLAGIKGLKIIHQPENSAYNYASFPVFIDAEVFGKTRDTVFNFLKEQNIYCRRYYYPLISNLPFYSDLRSASNEKLPIANKVTDEVLCLPLYSELKPEIAKNIAMILINCAS